MTATMKNARPFVLTMLLALTGASTAFGAATSKELLDCQKQLESQVRAFSNVVQTGLAGCAQKVVECALADEIDMVDPTACVAKATASCAGVPAKVADQTSKRQLKVLAKCGLVSLADLEQYTAGLGFYNASSGGTMTRVLRFATTKSLAAGDNGKINVGELTLKLDRVLREEPA